MSFESFSFSSSSSSSLLFDLLSDSLFDLFLSFPPFLSLFFFDLNWGLRAMFS